MSAVDAYKTLTNGSSSNNSTPPRHAQHHTIVYAQSAPPTPSCYVIVTSCSLLWTLLTLVTTAIIVVSIMSPNWLHSEVKLYGIGDKGARISRPPTLTGNGNWTKTEHRATIGIFNECVLTRTYLSPGWRRRQGSTRSERDTGRYRGDSVQRGNSEGANQKSLAEGTGPEWGSRGRGGRDGGEEAAGWAPYEGMEAGRMSEGTEDVILLHDVRHPRLKEPAEVLIAAAALTSFSDVAAADWSETQAACVTYVTGLDMPDGEFPDVWKSALIFLAAASALMTFTTFTAVMSVCVQAIFRKSIFTVSGLIQSVAALFLILGQLLYMAGWGSVKVRAQCGDRSGPFTPGTCTLGPSFYACAVGTALVFACALLSIQAEKATSTDKVEQRIVSGSNCVCIA